LKAWAIAWAGPCALRPAIPTAAGGGVPTPGFTSWFGFFGPKALPDDVVLKLNAPFAGAARELAQEGRLAAIGIEPVAETPAAFASFVRRQVERNGKLLRDANSKPE